MIPPFTPKELIRPIKEFLYYGTEKARTSAEVQALKNYAIFGIWKAIFSPHLRPFP